MAVHNLTSEQFESMLSVLTTEQRESFLTTILTYQGVGDKSILETFLNCINVYKNVEKLSSEEMLEKMDKLLKLKAANWWNQNKKLIKTWKDFQVSIKKEFLKKLPHEIFQEIFRRQEVNEPTAKYVADRRALFEQLPDVYTDNAQLDIIYCFLNFKVKEKIARESIESFEGLIMAATECEQDPSFRKRKRNKCSFCRLPGHLFEECKKRAKLEEENKVETKDVGIQMPHPSDPKYYCYGCNMPNMVRSQCPVCLLKPIPKPEFEPQFY